MLGYLHSFTLALLTYLIASAFLFIINFSPLREILDLINQKSEVENYITRREYLILFLTAVFGLLIALALYLNGLFIITAVNAAFLASTGIIFI